MQQDIIRGYHGTTQPAAHKILSERRFHESTGDYHWLGPGVYFWQDAPLRAWQWALYKHRQTGDAPAVVSAEILQQNVLDLLDIGNSGFLQATYRSIKDECDAAEGWLAPDQRPLPQQHAPVLWDADGNSYRIGQSGDGDPKYNWLDHAVIERATHALWERKGFRTKVIRCAFAEGKMLYPSSYFFDRSHVQVVVREPDVIKRIALEDSDLLRKRYDQQVSSWASTSQPG